MKVVHWIVIGALTTVLLGAGCAASHQYNSMPGVSLNASLDLEDLKRSEYKILGDTEGEGCATYTGLWPIPIFWFDSEEVTGSVYGIGGGGSRAQEIATYKAIEKIPGADALISPRYKQSSESVGIWWSKDCVTVKGKAISLNTDTGPVQSDE